MTKKSELWVAAGGDELTCCVSLHHDGIQPRIRIVLSGTVMAGNRYVTNILLALLGSVDYSHAEIDAREVAFFDRGHVNQHAVESLLIVVTAIAQDKRTAVLSLSDGCVLDVLEDVLGRTAAFRHSVFLQADDSAELARVPQCLSAATSLRALPTAGGGRESTRQRTFSDYMASVASYA